METTKQTFMRMGRESVQTANTSLLINQALIDKFQRMLDREKAYRYNAGYGLNGCESVFTTGCKLHCLANGEIMITHSREEEEEGE